MYEFYLSFLFADILNKGVFLKTATTLDFQMPTKEE
jgi:hypothetical protein